MDMGQSIEITQQLIENELFCYGGAYSKEEKMLLKQLVFHIACMANNCGDVSENARSWLKISALANQAILLEI